MKRTTIKDIARYLSVSVSTVSRALADNKNIRADTRQKVVEAAEALGYKPNPVATNLKYGHTNTVGVIVPEMVTPFAAKVIKGIQHILYANNIKVIIAESGEDPEQERSSLELMDNFMVDGIIVGICSYKHNRDIYDRLIKNGMPIVFYDRIPYGLDVSQVIVDDYMKSFFMVEKMIRGGRRHIVHLAGADRIYNAIEREKGYVDAMRKFSLGENIKIVKAGGMDFADGRDVAISLMQEKCVFDAVFAFTDTLAIGLMNGLADMGVDIPCDVAVSSFSGTELATIVRPQLSTVEPPLFEMGVKAAELVLERIGNPLSPQRSIVLDAEIKMRHSFA